MAQTGSPDTLSPADLDEMARVKAADGNSAGGLERVVRMAQAAARIHEAQNLQAIRPDLTEEDVDFTVPKRTKLLALIRPTGPRFRRTKVGIVRARDAMGLDG